LQVTNVNEHTPTWQTFTPAGTTYSLSESVPAGTSVLTVTATDGDAGPEGVVTYGILSTVASGTGQLIIFFYEDILLF
jgi:hypothetical protein